MISEPETSTVPQNSGLAAALWDFDGTLADTEPIWIAAEYRLVGSLGGEWSEEHAHQLVGNSLLGSAAYIAKTIGRPDLDPAWIVEQLITQVVATVRSEPIPWRPGALDLLKSFSDAQVPCVLVSASYRVLLDAILEQLPEGTFVTSVGGDEVTKGKPDPEPYLEACRRLQVDPSDCVVLEDSVFGTQSGNAAGSLVLAIENVVPIPEAPNRIQLDSLTDVDATKVAELMRQWKAGELENAAAKIDQGTQHGR